MELHKEPEGKQGTVSYFESPGSSKSEEKPFQPHLAGTAATLTRQDACQINHPHFKSFVDQFQRDSQQQLHQQVAHDVLYSTLRRRNGKKTLETNAAGDSELF